MQRGTANLRFGNTKRPGAGSYRTCSLFLIFFLLLLGQSVFAQEDAYPEEEPGPDWGSIASSPYTFGDRNFIISLGVLIPTFFGGDIENNEHGLRLGGTGSLAFNYFLNSNFFVGGELAGSFSGTRGGNMLYMVPFGVRAGFQFLLHRFEFPVSVMLGGIASRYLDRGYFGLIVKPSASAYWRFSPEWSFGLNSAWWFVPQWPRNGNKVYGNFMELTLSARYHF